MRKILLLCALCVCVGKVHAQKNVWLKEINQDIWTPFMEAYQQTDVAKYKALHTQDLIRATGAGKQIKDLPTYSAEVGKWFAELKQQKTQVSIKFRFLERITNGKTASERGIYELMLANEANKEQRYYGKFHVFLRKEKKKWKIAIDYDSNEGDTISADDFQKAFDIDAFEKY
jgi:ketosteroid isomerase-like protein